MLLVKGFATLLFVLMTQDAECCANITMMRRDKLEVILNDDELDGNNMVLIKSIERKGKSEIEK